MQGILNAVRKDKSGEALAGLRSGVSDYMIDIMTSPSRFDINNRPIVSGSQLKNQLTNENSRAAMSKVFNKKEMANWDKIADQLVIAQRQADKSGRPLPFIINDRSSWLLNTAARMFGARLGSRLAAGSGMGGQLQASGIASQGSKDIMTRLTADKAKQLLIDAVTTDEQLLIRLLQPRTAASDKKFGVVLRNYMLNNGRRLLDDDEETAPEAP